MKKNTKPNFTPNNEQAKPEMKYEQIESKPLCKNINSSEQLEEKPLFNEELELPNKFKGTKIKASNKEEKVNHENNSQRSFDQEIRIEHQESCSFYS